MDRLDRLDWLRLSSNGGEVGLCAMLPQNPGCYEGGEFDIFA